MSVKRYTPKINIAESSEDVKVQLWEVVDSDGRYVLHADYAALLARYNALREAVAWRKECELVRHYVIFEALETCALREITSSISAARAEVDRLLSEDSNDGNS